MSYLLGINNLQIGYWLAKKSVLENNLVYRKEISTKVYNFLLVAGIFILLKNLILKILGKINYFSEMNNEIKLLKNSKNSEYKLSICLTIIINKILLRIKNL